jgi:hypothetical protein
MAEFFLYLVESSAVLSVLYLIYVIALRKETFFTFNRYYLLVALAVSLVLPIVNMEVNTGKEDIVSRSVDEMSKFRRSYHDALVGWDWDFQFEQTTSSSARTADELTSTGYLPYRNLLILVTFIYVIGMCICLSRTFWSLFSLRKMIYSYPHKVIEGIKVVRLPFFTAPFSFFRYLFVHADLVETPEFPQILLHESTHIRERHSIDLVFVQLAASIFWFNPIVWRLAKSLKSTHEYIADKQTINSGYSLVEYQSLLLKQLISNNSFGLVHNFNLSFIKKRITMMTHKPSGWAGKVKVAGAIVCTAIVSLIIVQCNSRIDEALEVDAATSIDNPVAGVNLPVLPMTDYRFKGDLTETINIVIVGNKLSIEGEEYTVDQIASFFERGNYTAQTTLVMMIDQGQTMEFVRKVDMELRKAEKRKLLYVGQSANGDRVETSILLPPTPENAAKNGMPMEPDMSKVEAEGNTGILKIDLGKPGKVAYQEKVYDFVKEHIENENMLYVVSAYYEDDDRFNDYLSNLVYIKEGFYKLYQERSMTMFGKDFLSLGKEEYHAARVPMNISIAEKH